MAKKKRLEWTTEKRTLGDLIPYEHNPRQLSEKQYHDLKASLARFDLAEIPAINTDNKLVAGHQRVRILLELEGPDREVDVRVPNRKLTKEEFDEYLIRSNKNTGDWDLDVLANAFDVDDLKEWGFDDFELGMDEEEEYDGAGASSLQERFGIPPFSVWMTRAGYWIERLEMWRNLICDKGETRENALATGGLMAELWANKNVSVLDAVMMETVCEWYTAPDDLIIDPFAGDTVGGFVSGHLGRRFLGVDIREDQVELNNERTSHFKSCKYICDDGRNILSHAKKSKADFLFSCPPYFDLEKYGDDPRDGANMTYPKFLKLLKEALSGGVESLKANRFAVIVISDVKDKDGVYRGLPTDVVKIMLSAGCSLFGWNILVNKIGAYAVLADSRGRFQKYRSPLSIHQDVIVFCNGDAKKAAARLPEIEIREETDDTLDV
jgi:hypothetical protein